MLLIVRVWYKVVGTASESILSYIASDWIICVVNMIVIGNDFWCGIEQIKELEEFMSQSVIINISLCWLQI